MIRISSTWVVAGVALASAVWLSGGCGRTGALAPESWALSTGQQASPSPTIPAGTMIAVILASTLSSETALVGDRWQGTVAGGSSRRVGDLIPGGSHVEGDVVAVRPAVGGSCAMLQLDLTSIRVDGRDTPIDASGGEVVARSTRDRLPGAIAGEVPAGAPIGDGGDTAAGGPIVGAAATGVVAGVIGLPVVLASGTLLSFTIGQPVALR